MATKASSLHWNYGPYHANRLSAGMELWASTPIEGDEPTMTSSIPWVLSSVPPGGSEWLWRYGVIRASHLEDFEAFIEEYRSKCPGCLHSGISLTPGKVTWDQYLDMLHAADRAGICSCAVERTKIFEEWTETGPDAGYLTTVYRYAIGVDGSGYVNDGAQWTPPNISNVWFDLLIKGYRFNEFTATRTTYTPYGWDMPTGDMPPPDSPAVSRFASNDGVSGALWASHKSYPIIDTPTGKATSGINEELTFDLTRVRTVTSDGEGDHYTVDLDGDLIEGACLVLRTYAASGSL